MNLDDTIVAVSSPAGAGERAILRLSGPRALQIADRVFVPGVLTAATYTAHAGRLELAGERLSVPAMAYLMRGPRSYTREDVVEFHVGAWPALEGLMVAGLVAAGARPAEPGEFTFRALMSGRLDLAQAEAVMEVVNAGSASALRAAEDLLGGHLSREVSGIIEEVRDVLALVEAGLDFSDQDIEIAPPDVVAARADAARGRLADLGRRARGIETFSGSLRLVVAGRPNAGKSSLFNRLLEADRAIVSPEAGTTRDELRAALHVGGLVFALSDIAGIDEARDELGAKAQAKAAEAIGGADLVLVAIDATAPSYEGTDELMGLVAAPMVVAVTKCDLAPPEVALGRLAARGVTEVIATSAVTGEGLEDLRSALVRAVEGGGVDRQAAGPVVTARHRSSMERAAVALARASRLARRAGVMHSRGGRCHVAQPPPAVHCGELAALELRESLEALGGILGRKADTDVLDAIFSRFCIGK